MFNQEPGLPATDRAGDWLVPSRRKMLQGIGGGFASLALAELTSRESHAAKRVTLDHEPKVKRVIQLFMTGGASPMDTFDYKPALEKHHGQSIGPKEKIEGLTSVVGAVMKSPFTFRQHGKCGRWVSSVFPKQAELVDELAFLMAMKSRTNVHGPGTYLQNSGSLFPGFPCMGAWISYALGNLVDNLPCFVVLPDPKGLPYNQRGCFSSGFLPAIHQGTTLSPQAKPPIPDLFPDRARHAFASDSGDAAALDLLQRINREHASRRPDDSRLDARIEGYELAARMQLAAPEVFDLSRETQATQAAYGLGQPATDDFGRRCLLAARLVEKGVRFVQIWSGPQGASGNWDNHGNIETQLPPMALSVDQPIAALLRDLKARGLDRETLVVWSTEFGRTPFAQASLGRDHNGECYVNWLWGAGIKGGVAYGESDELGYQAAVDKTDVHDLHATILHLMGLDHERLTVRHDGIDRRLTDVHGHVVDAILS